MRIQWQRSADMDALLVLTEPPLPFGGAASRWNYVLATELRRRGAALTILCCSGGVQRDAEAAELMGRETDIHFFPPQQRRGLRRISSLVRPVSHLFSCAMREKLYSLDLERFDIIQFETHFAGWLVDKPIDNAVLNVHSLYSIDHQNADSSLGGRLASVFLMRAERQMLSRFRRLSALTPRLAQRVREIAPQTSVGICPMSVDLALYDYAGRPRRTPGSACIGMIGSYHWAPTRSAGAALVDRIWLPIKRQFADSRLLLVGRQAAEYCAQWAHLEGVEIFGDVADTQPFFHELDVMVYLPTVGSGMKVKVMESIAMGTPVVTNAEGGEGLPDEIASVVCVENDGMALDRISWLIRHPDEASEQAEQLRSILARELSIDTCVDKTLAFACRDALA